MRLPVLLGLSVLSRTPNPTGRILLIAAAAFACTPANAGADSFTLGNSYTFTALDIPGAASDTTFAHAINNRGEVVGIFGEPGVGYHGFLYSNNTFTTIDVPGGDWAIGYGINNLGDVVGSTGNSFGNTGFVASGGNITTFSVPGSLNTNLSGINDQGQMVGGYFDPTVGGGLGTYHGFLYSDGTFTTIDPNVVGGLYGINNKGQIVGDFGVLNSDGSFTRIAIGESSNAMAINDRGQVAGTYSDSLGVHGFLLDPDGSLTTIDVPGVFPICNFPPCVTNTHVFGLNDIGEVVGYYHDSTGQHAFIGTPTPEPSSFALVLMGLAVATWRRQKTRRELHRLRPTD